MSRRKQAKPLRLQDDEDQTYGESKELDKFANDGGVGGNVTRNSDDDHEMSEADDREDESLVASDASADDGMEKKVVDLANNNNSINNNPLPAIFQPLAMTRKMFPGHSDGDGGSGDSEGKTSDSDDEGFSVRHRLTMEKNNPVADQLKAVTASIAKLVQDNHESDDPKVVQDLAVLQATLFSLQQQQLLQMQILTQMQTKINLSKDDATKNLAPPSSAVSEALSKLVPEEQDSLRKLHSFISSGDRDRSRTVTTTNCPTFSPTTTFSSMFSPKETDPTPNLPPTTLASSIITHSDPPEGPSRPVNSLELLEQKAQGILDNASQGLLANSLVDFSNARYQDSGIDRKNEPYFKHRCKYCEKVFGSDSALEIHIRSHTGERPYKCNICGNRFTTKGNLKVHFSRHSSSFPHIKMNVNLVVEHLDKWFPPLLQQIEEAEKKGLPTPSMTNPLAGCFPVIPPGTKLSEIPPGVMMPNLSPSPRPTMPNLPNMPNMPTMPILPNMPVLSLSNMPPMLNRKSLSSISGMPLLTSLKGSIPLSLPNEPIRREDILKMPPSSVSGSHPPIMFPFQNIEKREENLPERDPGFAFKPIFLGPKETKTASENEKEQQARNEEKIQKMRDELIEAENRRNNTSTSTEYDNSDQEEHEEPQNLSQDKHDAERSPSPVPSLPIKLENDRSHPLLQVPHLPMGLMRLPPRLPFDSNLLLNRLPSIENSDDAWESFIEVDRASETSKLEHFVNSLDHKLSDPNECIVCHKVLSCKSALQMHYRIHTGERPYKCKVCKRCFTTKGNLKTHMSVHRIRAPMRMFHQCLVCHKRYPNNIVLQEHIKTHTGEPTDLTLEQISAAEIKDFPPVGLGSPNNGSSPLFLPSSPFSPGFYTSFGGGDKRGWDDQMRDDERDSDTHSRASSVTSSGTPEDCGREEGGECQPCVPSSKLVRPFLIENPIGLSAKNQPEDLSTSNKNPDDQNHQVTQLRLSSSPEAEDGVSFQKDTDSPHPSSHTTKDSPSPATSPLPNHSNSPSPTGPEGQKSPSPSSPSPTRQDSQGSPSPTTRAGLDLMRPDVIPKSFPMTKSPSPLDLTHGNPLNHYLMANPLSLLGTPGMTPQSLLSQLTGGLPPGLNPFAGLGLGLGLPPSPFGFTLGGDRIIGQGTTTCQVCFKVFACASALEIHMRSHTKIRPFKCPECERGFSTKGNLRQHLMTHSHGEEGGGDEMDHSSDKSDKFDNEDEIIANQADIKAEERRQEDAASSIKRSFPDGDDLLPIPKRPSGLPKHMCHVCNKNFSSSSAAMIHLRTHTGERPFKCSVCGKGFTTRGNLKVHMSVHMYTSSQASRRGRRMSLDLPPIPMNARDTEFLQRHPDIVLPYLQHRPLPPSLDLQHRPLPPSLDLQHRPLPPLSLPSSLGPPSLGKPLSSSLQPPILTSMSSLAPPTLSLSSIANSLAPPSLSLSSIANSLGPPSLNLPRSPPTLSMSVPASVKIPSSALNSRHGEPLSPQMVGLVRSGAGHPPLASPSLPPRPPYGVFRSLPPSTHDEPEALRIPPSQEYQYGHCESKEDKPTNLGRHNQPNTAKQETQTLGSNCLEGKHKHQALQI